jgi:hypothetical protein
VTGYAKEKRAESLTGTERAPSTGVKRPEHKADFPSLLARLRNERTSAYHWPVLNATTLFYFAAFFVIAVVSVSFI